MIDQDAMQSTLSREHLKRQRQIFKATVALAIGVSLIYIAFLKPGIWGIDGTEMFHMANSLVTQGNLTVPQGAGVLGHDGNYYSTRYPLLSILAVPLVAIGLGIGNLLDLPTRYTASACALVLSVLLTAITTSFVALLSLRLGSSKKGAYLAALGFAFGTTALVYSREFFAEPLLSLITVICLYLALGKTSREHTIASILAAFAIAAKPAGIVIGPSLCVYFLCKKYPLRTIVGPLMGTGMGILMYMGYNYIRFADFLHGGQKASGFQWTGTPERFFGLIFSPGAGGGLLWYCPVVILSIFGFRKALKTKPLEALLVMGIFVSYWVLHSFWEFEGWNWGPRFLVPALPGLLALTSLINKKWWDALIILTLIGFFWNAPTLFSYYQRYYAEANDQGYLHRATALWGSPFESPLFNAWGAAFRQLGDALATNVKDLIREVGAPPSGNNLTKSELLRIVAVWWWFLPVAGIPIWIGLAIAAILVGTGGWILWRGWTEV